MDDEECPETFFVSQVFFLSAFLSQTLLHIKLLAIAIQSNTSQTFLPLIIIPNFQDAIITISPFIIKTTAINLHQLDTH